MRAPSEDRHWPLPRWIRWCVTWCLVVGGLSAMGDPVPRQVLVKVAGGEGPRLQGAAALQVPDGARVLRSSPRRGWHLVELAPGQDVRSGLAWFRARREVSVAEPNHRYRLHAEPTDPKWGWLTGLTTIGAPAAWSIGVGSTNIVAAILDTGIDTGHPDLAPNLWRNPREIAGNGVDDDRNGVVDDVLGADFADEDGDPTDDAGHGTHVAGTIGAAANNGQGVAGVCWNVRLLAVRVGRADGFGDTFALASAFDYVVGLKQAGVDVRVINCSWGGGFPSVMLKEAIVAAGEAGMVIVCSAGNDRQDNDLLPAYPCGYDCPQILSVAASTACDELANFSNFGVRTVHLAAPGRDILSTFRGGARYGVLSGTSMAAPHVSGAVALLASQRPDLTASQLKALMLATVAVQPGLTNRVISGGRLDLGRAMARLAAGDVAGLVPTDGTVALKGGRISAVTRRPDGRWGNDNSSEPVISADGRWVAFSSAATNLVPGMDATDYLHVFLRDRVSNTVVRVSQSPGGVGGRGDSEAPAISADGRFVAFASKAANLVTGDSNNAKDVFLWSRETGTIELMSVRTDGRASGNGASGVPSVSADGSVVAFESVARDLVSSDRNGQSDIFLRDRARGVTERVSVTSGGGEAVGGSEAPSISGDGRVVAFHSGAANLVAGDSNQSWDVFVRDRVTGITERVSVDGRGVAGDSDSVYPLISADGQRVIFHSLASNYDDRGGGYIGVFLRDRVAGTLVRANAVVGAEAGGDAYVDGFSGDGRWVCFTTDDPVLGPGGAPGFFRAWMFDALTGHIGQIGVNEGGYDPDNNTFYGRPSGDGRYVVFASYASNPVAGNGSALGNVYVEDFGGARADLGIRPAGVVGSAWKGWGTVHPGVPQRVLSQVSRGSTAAYEVSLLNLGVPRAFRLTASWPGTTQIEGWAVRVTREGSAETLLPSLAGAGWVSPVLGTGSNLVLRVELDRMVDNGRSTAAAVRIQVTADGEGPGAAVLDAVTAAAETDMLAGGRLLVSRAVDGAPAARNAEAPAVSRDGRWVAFSSEADHLEARADTNFQSDIFLFDRETRGVRRVSDASSTEQADADSHYPTLSGDGRLLAFQSRASNLVGSDTNDVEDVFVKDLQTGVLTRASVSVEGRQGTRGSDSALISTDGRWLAFASLATNFVTGDTNQSQDVFLRNLETGALECVSCVRGGGVGDADSEVVAVTGDGRFVLFNSYAGNLAPSDSNAMMDVFLLDRGEGTLELLSRGTNGVPGNGPSRASSISDDGRWVTFSSLATDLGPAPLVGEVGRRGFVLDRLTGQVRAADRMVPLASLGSLAARGAVVGAGGKFWAVAARGACGVSPAADQVVSTYFHSQSVSGSTLVSSLGTRGLAEDHSFVGRISPDERYLGFESYSSQVLGDFHRGAGQVYLVDMAVGGVGMQARRDAELPWRGELDALTSTSTSAGVPDIAKPVPFGIAPGVYGLRVVNGGNVPERLRVLANVVGPAFSKVQVTALTAPVVDITADVRGTGWLTPVLQPREVLEVEVLLELVEGSAADGTIEFVVRWGATSVSGGLRTRLVAEADQDADGLADTWETRWFGGLSKAGKGTDADADGMSDAAEQEAGTDPTDPASQLRLVAEPVGGGTRLQLSWRAETDRYYALEMSDAALRFGWTANGEWHAGSGAIQSRMVPAVGEGVPSRGLYRLRVERP